MLGNMHFKLCRELKNTSTSLNDNVLNLWSSVDHSFEILCPPGSPPFVKFVVTAGVISNKDAVPTDPTEIIFIDLGEEYVIDWYVHLNPDIPLVLEMQALRKDGTLEIVAGGGRRDTEANSSTVDFKMNAWGFPNRGISKATGFKFLLWRDTAPFSPNYSGFFNIYFIGRILSS